MTDSRQVLPPGYASDQASVMAQQIAANATQAGMAAVPQQIAAQQGVARQGRVADDTQAQRAQQLLTAHTYNALEGMAADRQNMALATLGGQMQAGNDVGANYLAGRIGRQQVAAAAAGPQLPEGMDLQQAQNISALYAYQAMNGR